MTNIKVEFSDIADTSVKEGTVLMDKNGILYTVIAPRKDSYRELEILDLTTGVSVPNLPSGSSRLRRSALRDILELEIVDSITIKVY